MQIALWIAGGAIVLLLLDRVALWAERKGWVYYRKTPGRRGGMGDIFNGAMAPYDSTLQHIQTAKQTKKGEERENGDPPGIER